MTQDIRLQLQRLSKSFGSTLVLDGVDLQVRVGQVHGLIGQNGAGKSTIVKILGGLYPDHGGEVVVGGHTAALKTPRSSRAAGIAVIYQEFSLVGEMSIAENLLLGRETNRIAYNAKATVLEARRLLERVGIELGADVSERVASQSPAVRQRIEIAKALAQNAQVLVMDEPTARLSEAERVWLFDTMRRLADSGVGIMFISHFLDEVLAVTDWVTVLRNGTAVASQPASNLTVGRMAELMLGTELLQELGEGARDNRADESHPITLAADNVSVGPRLQKVSVALRRGEILGVAGLVGSGRTRLCRVLAGVDRPSTGHRPAARPRCHLSRPTRRDRPGHRVDPRRPQASGPVPHRAAAGQPRSDGPAQPLGRAGVVSRRSVRALATRLITELEVTPANPLAAAATLSGGNQQKIVLGKALAAQPEVLIVDQPTAGVDVGTKAQIHRLLRQRALDGGSILVVSDDIDELFSLADRFCVLRKGRVLWQGPSSTMRRDQLLALIAAGSADGLEPTERGTR